ncbi:hypothetical protein PR202_gb06577 [Eleusine coracana subsp. coracana]|uniref:Uncharacterized protein n=1 Tax=Eleusine coracana subsp. coracana TaxID=191504 RepID=A0AAV5E869_ELECO|nr:hypothetical protein QOZ80_2BG0159270 [Eleusine coracana subsp. coracana]GJN19314.1 hypothetical protein PR202_gb06577 [Eleusine coracana subsp. coracana]
MADDSHETASGASSSGSYFSATTVDAAHLLRRQRSTPAAAARGRGAHAPIIILGNGGFSGQCAPASRGSPGAVARAVWAWLVRGKKKVLRRSGSSAAKEQYGQEEYAQNFDEGAAAADELENLSRSFSARYAGRRLAAGAGAVGQPGSLRSSRWSV